jgi:glycosyltransferase involved in cell wall biosynthesis
MNNKIGLWLGQLGDANSWYHIFPFSSARQTKKLYVLRHNKPINYLPNSEVIEFKRGNAFLTCFKLFFKGIKILRKKKVDYIITFNPFPHGTVAWILARLFSVPISIGLIGSDFNIILKKKIFRWFMLRVLRKSNVVTITGNAMRPFLEANGVISDKILIYPHCVHDKWFEFPVKDYSSKSIDLITVSSLAPGKRIQDIIVALSLLQEKNIRVSLTIIGVGPEENYLKSLVDKYNLKNQVEFLGYQADILKYLQNAKVYVQASAREGLSLSLVEAMAAGVVPIATKAGSEEDIIDSGKNGILVNINNPLEIANAIEELLQPSVYEKYNIELLQNQKKFKMSYAIEVAEIIINKLLEQN